MRISAAGAQSAWSSQVTRAAEMRKTVVLSGAQRAPAQALAAAGQDLELAGLDLLPELTRVRRLKSAHKKARGKPCGLESEHAPRRDETQPGLTVLT